MSDRIDNPSEEIPRQLLDHLQIFSTGIAQDYANQYNTVFSLFTDLAYNKKIDPSDLSDPEKERLKADLEEVAADLADLQSTFLIYSEYLEKQLKSYNKYFREGKLSEADLETLAADLMNLGAQTRELDTLGAQFRVAFKAITDYSDVKPLLLQYMPQFIEIVYGKAEENPTVKKQIKVIIQKLESIQV